MKINVNDKQRKQTKTSKYEMWIRTNLLFSMSENCTYLEQICVFHDDTIQSSYKYIKTSVHSVENRESPRVYTSMALKLVRTYALRLYHHLICALLWLFVRMHWHKNTQHWAPNPHSANKLNYISFPKQIPNRCK